MADCALNHRYRIHTMHSFGDNKKPYQNPS
jgi:hypothetical protein